MMVSTKKQENIVIYDESKVLANAQRWAAERRGIVGPGLPEEVLVQRVDSPEQIPAPPTEETVRGRSSVVQETRECLGYGGAGCREGFAAWRCA